MATFLNRITQLTVNSKCKVNPFSTWRLHVAWMYICWVCTRAARKENPNSWSLLYWVSGNVRVRILICATRQKPCRKHVYPNVTVVITRAFSILCIKTKLAFERALNRSVSHCSCNCSTYKMTSVACPSISPLSQMHTSSQSTIYNRHGATCLPWLL